MTVLRQARLDAVRHQLLRGGQSVTEVAQAHGFEHLGRFSAYYRARFGELPSATAR
jgi:AraC-like DNA-binding protein